MTTQEIKKATEKNPTFINSWSTFKMKVWRKKAGNIVQFEGFDKSNLPPRSYKSNEPFFTTANKAELKSEFEYLIDSIAIKKQI